MPSADLRRRAPCFLLAQYRDDLFLGEPTLTHRPSPSGGKEYTDCCLTPYDMTFQTDDPKRQLFYNAVFNREEREAVGHSDAVDFTAKQVLAESTRSHTTRPRSKVTDGASRFLEATEFHAPNFYPERWRSRLLVLRNLWLPFHNWRFAILFGLIYMVLGWVFQLSVADPLEGVRQSRYAQADVECLARLKAIRLSCR